jgi:hypothetical protein
MCVVCKQYVEVMCFKGYDYCSENCRKKLHGE